MLVNGPEKPLTEIAREIETVPEAMLIDELLELLRGLREHLALVIDEHGTTVGLITLEDVIEEIVGEIEDEFDPEEREPVRRDGDSTIVAGWAPVRLVEERLGIELPDHHEATLGGVILEQLGRLPAAGRGGRPRRQPLRGRQGRARADPGAPPAPRRSTRTSAAACRPSHPARVSAKVAVTCPLLR